MRYDMILGGLIGKLTNSFVREIGSEGFLTAYKGVETLLHGQHFEKSLPYRLFEDSTLPNSNFKTWAVLGTQSIDKDFNKGRKVVRMLDNLFVTYGNLLPFTLTSSHSFDFVLDVLAIDLSTCTLDENVGIYVVILKRYLETLFGILIIWEHSSKVSNILVASMLVCDSIFLDVVLGVDALLQEVDVDESLKPTAM